MLRNGFFEIYENEQSKDIKLRKMRRKNALVQKGETLGSVLKGKSLS